MSTLILVLVVILSGFLVNKLSDRYDFPAPDWALWAAVLGLGLLYEQKDRLPQQLARYFEQTQAEQLGQWVFWGAAGVIVLAMLARVVWPRPNVPEAEPAKIKTTPSAQDKDAAYLRGRLL